MKIVIFEYLCGGGFCNDELPTSLAREGALMLNALLADFSALPEHQLLVLQDWRYSMSCLPANAQAVLVTEQQNVLTVFSQSLENCEAAWLIAPETDSILFDFAQQVEQMGKLLLSSPSTAIAKTADKWQTFNLLSAHRIATVATQRLAHYDHSFSAETVLKAIDGIGCENSFLLNSNADVAELLIQIQRPENYIIQPYIKGESLSLSVLFNQGHAHLLCVNRQRVKLHRQSFKLLACEVNVLGKSAYQPLVREIAHAFPDLFGYVGIDIIVQDEKIWVLEINPRLTSSYAGIAQALGINVAAAVLQLMSGSVELKSVYNQSVIVNIVEGVVNVV
jgi:predicted ATP-grasp superfamily ATP-dependent carboligase